MLALSSTGVHGALQLGLHDPIPAHLMRFEEERLRYLKLVGWSTQGLSHLFLSVYDQLQLVRICSYLLSLCDYLRLPHSCHLSPVAGLLIDCCLLCHACWTLLGACYLLPVTCYLSSFVT